MPSPSHRRLTLVVAAALGLVLVGALVGLLASSGDRAAQVAPTVTPPARPAPAQTEQATPSAPPAAPVPDVPVRDSSLAAQIVRDDPPPVGLTLPALGVEVPVDPVGVDTDGQMEIPPNAARAGWYRFGPAPGSDRGAAVIAAHVDSVASAGLGPFARLRDLSPGDEAMVALADGSTVTYRVREVTSYPKTDVTWPDVFVRDGPAHLVLITCGGRWQPDVRHYSDNVFVHLSPAEP